jgi:hypothetical protein
MGKYFIHFDLILDFERLKDQKLKEYSPEIKNMAKRLLNIQKILTYIGGLCHLMAM